MSLLLEASQVSFHRQGERIFAPTSLELHAGQALVVLGPNGSGKTTLLRLLSGILEAAEGKLARHGRVAFLGHQQAFKGDLSCRENLDFLRRFLPARALSTSQALARVGLAGLGLRPARTLSAGQKKRLGLAGMLVARREIWLLDEPYASLDLAGGQLVDSLIGSHLDQGGAVALSTHQRQPVLSQPAGQLLIDSPVAQDPNP